MSVVAATSRTAHGTGIDGAVAQVTAPSVEKTFVGAIDGFDIKSELGPKGVRTLDRATGLALAAISDLAKDANALHKLSDLQDEASLILGTSYGSLSSTINFTRSGLEGNRPYHVDPSRFPNTVMNFAAGQAAIRFGVSGPNVTVIGGGLTGLASVRYASRLLKGHQAKTVILAAAEELSEERRHLTELQGRELPLGEASVALLLEPYSPGRPEPQIVGVSSVRKTSSTTEKATLGRLLDTSLASSSGQAPDIIIDSSSDKRYADAVVGALKQRSEISLNVDVLRLSDGFGDIGAAALLLGLGMAAELLRAPKHQNELVAWIIGDDERGLNGITVMRSSDDDV